MAARGRGARAYALPALAAALAAAFWLQGAFYDAQLAIVFSLLVLGVAVAGRPGTPPVDVWLGFGALGVGLLASAAGTGWPAEALKPALTLGAAVATFVLARSAALADGRAAVAELCVAVVSVAALIGIVAVAFHIERFALAEHPWRLTSTLTYQNAAASAFATVLPVALVLAARGRAGARAGVVLLAAGLVATLSRGGAVAAVVGVAIVVGARVVPSAGLARLAAGTVLASVGLVPAMLDMPASPVVAVVALGAGLLIAGSTVALVPRRILIGVAALAATGGLIFATTTPIRGRLVPTSTDRGRVWSETAKRLPERPLFGTGPGTYELVAIKDGVPVRTHYAHNEYLQTLAETGVAGLVSLLGGMALWARAGSRSEPRDGLWWAAFGGSAGFLIHSALDYLWRIPALVMLVMILLAVWTTTEGEAPALGDEAADTADAR